MRHDSSPDQRLYRLIFEHSSQPTIVVDDDGRLLSSNLAAQAFERDSGVDFRSFFVWSAARDADLASFRAQLRVGGRARGEIRVTNPDGSERCLALEGRSHGPTHVVTIADVTERRQLDQELRHLRRLEAVGATTAGVVHDFNNMLAAVLCSSAALAGALRHDERARTMALEIQHCAEKAAGLVRRILRMMRRESAPPQRLQLSVVVSELRPLLQLVAGHAVELALDVDAETPETVVERERLEQVIINLVANARDAMPQGGRITISTAGVPVSRDAGPASTAWVALKVTDDGEGMAPEVLERVFERFFTTKELDRGTGLGLASAHRFVKASGGCMSIKSAPGRGTTVIVYLPRACVASEAPATSSSAAG